MLKMDMDPTDRKVRFRQGRQVPSESLSEKLYPMRHCLMITGAVLVVIDIGLFIGGIAVIAAGIDMDTYGFAAMIAFSVLTMVFACVTLICGCRSKSPRSKAYKRAAPSEIRTPPILESPPKVTPHQDAAHLQLSNRDRFAHMPASSRPQATYPPNVIRVQFETPTEGRPHEASGSRWSHNATCGESTNERHILRAQQPFQNSQYKKRVTDI